MIKKLNINNKKDFEDSIKMIYRTFIICNKEDSSTKLNEKMKKLFWENTPKEETIELFKKSEIILIYKKNWIINWIIRGRKDKIINLYIDPDSQWKWIWKKLLNRYFKEAKRLWSKNIYLKPSKYAYNFYIKQGFKKIDDKYLGIRI